MDSVIFVFVLIEIHKGALNAVVWLITKHQREMEGKSGRESLLRLHSRDTEHKDLMLVIEDTNTRGKIISKGHTIAVKITIVTIIIKKAIAGEEKH